MLFHLLESLIRKNCKHINKTEKLCIILMLNFSQNLDCKLRRVEKSNMKTHCESSLIHCDQEFGQQKKNFCCCNQKLLLWMLSTCQIHCSVAYLSLPLISPPEIQSRNKVKNNSSSVSFSIHKSPDWIFKNHPHLWEDQNSHKLLKLKTKNSWGGYFDIILKIKNAELFSQAILLPRISKDTDTRNNLCST